MTTLTLIAGIALLALLIVGATFRVRHIERRAGVEPRPHEPVVGRARWVGRGEAVRRFPAPRAAVPRLASTPSARARCPHTGGETVSDDCCGGYCLAERSAGGV